MHIDLVNSVVIGWIVGEFEVSAAEWGSHHAVFSESITFFVQPPAFKRPEISVHINVLPHHPELVSSWNDEWIDLGSGAFGGDEVRLVDGTLEWITKWTLWVVQVIPLDLGDIDGLHILGWKWFLPSSEEGSLGRVDNLDRKSVV